MAKAGYQSAGALLEAHAPEVLPFCPLLRKSLRIFRNHAKFLFSVSLATLVPPFFLLLIIQVFFAAPHNLSSQPPANPTPPTKLNAASTTLLLLYLLITFAVAVVQSAVFAHVVVGDHLGKPPGKLWLAVERSFWRLVGTNLAKFGMLMAIGFVGAMIIGLVMGLIMASSSASVASGPSTFYIVVVFLGLLFYTITLVVVALHLSFADQATVVESPNVWGWTAVSRSWALCSSSRGTILAVGSVHVLVAMLLTGPHNLLVTYARGSVSTTAALLVLYVIALGLTSWLEAYFRVVWIVLYLSARKKTDPGFGLDTLELYFEEESENPSEYLMVGVSDKV